VTWAAPGSSAVVDSPSEGDPTRSAAIVVLCLAACDSARGDAAGKYTGSVAVTDRIVDLHLDGAGDCTACDLPAQGACVTFYDYPAGCETCTHGFARITLLTPAGESEWSLLDPAFEPSSRRLHGVAPGESFTIRIEGEHGTVEIPVTVPPAGALVVDGTAVQTDGSIQVIWSGGPRGDGALVTATDHSTTTLCLGDDGGSLGLPAIGVDYTFFQVSRRSLQATVKRANADILVYEAEEAFSGS
jgi:hypothetical protein